MRYFQKSFRILENVGKLDKNKIMFITLIVYINVTFQAIKMNSNDKTSLSNKNAFDLSLCDF